MSTTIITTTTVTIEPTIDCAYSPLTTWTTSGTEVEFGRGTSDVTVDPSGSTNAVLITSMDGNASLVNTIEYDSNIGDTILWQWISSDSNTHQSTTNISETTLDNGSTRVTINVNGSLDTTVQSFATFTSTSSNSNRILSNFRVYDSGHNVLNMETVTTSTSTTTVSISPFTLPREDWYDSDGRIYKDAIIENLNALEDKLNELNTLNAFDVDYPDISTLSLSDVTLLSDDEKIVNLKSFIDIFDLVNYPTELEFSGTTIKKISYWNSSYNYITRTNLTTELTKTNKFLFYDFASNSTNVSNTVTTVATGTTLLGCYLDGRVINLITPFSAKLNLMYLLGNMPKTNQNFTVQHGVDLYYFSDGQQALLGHAESKSSPMDMIAYEEGR